MISFYKIQDIRDRWFPAFRNLYSAAFPYYEQRSMEQQQEAFQEDSYRLECRIENEVMVSFMAYWEFDEYIYVEHLAVSPEFRGENRGSEMLHAFLKEKSKTIVLEIDPVMDDITEKRFRFYRRLGFMPNPYNHLHPPYLKGHPPHPLLVMSYPQELGERSYKVFFNDLEHVVMKTKS